MVIANGKNMVFAKHVAVGGDMLNRLVAAAGEVIPEEVRGKASEREAFVSEALRKMLAAGFRGKQVVTCLPANCVALQHLRMGKMSPEDLVKALPFEAAGKLPFDPNRAMLRHTLAAEVYQNGEARQEVIVMAAPRDAVELILNDGRSDSRWTSDPGTIAAGKTHHVVAIVDGGPKIITFVVDGMLNDGGEDRQFGWGRFNPAFRGPAGAEQLRAAPAVRHVRLYDRALRTSEAIAAFRAGL